MYMRSGDIMVMAGESRLAVHAVPRVLAPMGKERLPSCLVEHRLLGTEGLSVGRDTRKRRRLDKVSSREIDVMRHYLGTSRINLNVRQVLGTGQGFPEGDSSESSVGQEIKQSTLKNKEAQAKSCTE